MKKDQVRLPLPEDVTEEAIDRHAFEADWDIRSIIHPDEETDQPYEIVWTTPGERASIHLIRDEALEMWYLVVQGPERDEIVRELRQSFEFPTLSELLSSAWAAETANEALRTATQVAVAAPAARDEDVLSLFENLLGHEKAEVRRHVLFLLTYIGWLEFMPLIEQIAADDPDASVRERATILLEGYELRARGELGDY